MKKLFYITFFLPILISVSTASVTPKEWTLLLFLNGNNNLNRFARENLIDMEKIGSSDQVNLVTQWADFEYKKTQRLFITRSKDPNKITSPVIQDMGPKVDMGDVKTLIDFIKWGVANYPAKHYFIVVWDHGTGWHAKDISHDEFTNHSITTLQLAQAMDEAAKIIGHKVDIYGSDACEMAMIEIASELSDSVDLYLGSEQDIPLDGWPYSKFLKPWTDNPNINPKELATIVHSEYLRYYRELNSKYKQATFSLFDLSATEQMHAAILDFGNELKKLSGANLVKADEALSNTMLITIDYYDLLGFAENLKAAKIDVIDSRTIDNLHTAANAYILLNGATTRWESNAKGISIWLPSSFRWYNMYLNQYKTLMFSKETHWEENIKVLQK